MSIATRIKTARRNAGVSQDQLAKLSGISSNGIAVLEQGARGDPRASTLLKLSAALNIPVSELLDAPPPEPSPGGVSIKDLAKVSAAYVEHAQTVARQVGADGEGALELAQKQHVFIEQWSGFVHERINAALDVEKVSSWMEVLRTSLYDLYAILDEVYGYAVEEHANRPAGELAQLQSVREQVREDRNRLAASG